MPPPAHQNNNNETFRLLDLSSDMSSEDLRLEIAPAKKKKLHRKGRSRGAGRSEHIPTLQRSSSGCHTRLQYAFCAAVAVCLVVLTYAVASLNERFDTLNVKVQKVSTSSDGVSDALQQCHSATKELRNNSSLLAERLDRMAAEHAALRDNVTWTTAELGLLQAKLAGMQDVTNPPIKLADLVKMVGDLGARLSGVDIAVKSAQETAGIAKQGLEDLRSMVNVTRLALNASSSERHAAADRLKQLSVGIDALNGTIAATLDNMQRRLDQYATLLSSEAAAVARLQVAQTTAPTMAQTAAPHTTPSSATSKEEVKPSSVDIKSVPRTAAATPAPLVTTNKPASPTKPVILESRT